MTLGNLPRQADRNRVWESSKGSVTCALITQCACSWSCANWVWVASRLPYWVDVIWRRRGICNWSLYFALMVKTTWLYRLKKWWKLEWGDVQENDFEDVWRWSDFWLKEYGMKRTKTETLSERSEKRTECDIQNDSDVWEDDDRLRGWLQKVWSGTMRWAHEEDSAIPTVAE